MSSHPEYILTLSCPDTTGIVYHVTGFLFERGCNVIDSAQFGDASTGLFFMRVHFSAPPPFELARLQEEFAPVAQRYRMDARISDMAVRPRVLMMVSKFGHCLNDLLFRRASGQLSIDIPAIVSNHTEFEPLAHSYRIPFFYLPVTPKNKAEQEARVLELVERERVDLVVLARYMQVLSPEFVERYRGRVINVHHSFLPAFSGAKPYHAAFARGVKLIGATAHYVTEILDDGPIIEQEVIRVSHRDQLDDLIEKGRDAERMVLSRAVRWHLEHRILLYGNKTVVFV